MSAGMKFDGGKPRMDLLLDGCPNALLRVSEVLTFGAEKYAAHNWKTVPDGPARYKAALLRHVTAHAMGEINDQESGLPHLSHAACCLLFMLELEQSARVVNRLIAELEVQKAEPVECSECDHVWQQQRRDPDLKTCLACGKVEDVYE